MKPLYKEISYNTATIFAKNLAPYKNLVYLHSARLDDQLARHSFIALDPYQTYQAHDPETTHKILNDLSHQLKTTQLNTIDNLPPFQGGIAGYISYDCARVFETLPEIAKNDLHIPNIAIGIYDLVVSFDHYTKQAWIISTGLPERDEQQTERAQQRLIWAQEQIQNSKNIEVQKQKIERKNIESNFTQKEYEHAVTKVINYIKEGDIFEANLSQQFSCSMPKDFTPHALFEKLLEHNPAPFAAFINLGDLYILSSSPERFIHIKNNQVEARPIKGTIKRSNDPLEDQQLAEILKNSEKDHAENAMIVDLMRNDLSKICEPHSVIVEKLCGLESFATVHHLVSVITGQLKENMSFKDILMATLPGGSITGAPKIRAMEIIEELEPTRRGIYCGNAFYFGFDQTFDSSILIRTYTIHNNTIRFQAGGAVVLDSNPLLEYEETLTKAAPLIAALTS